jgi:hypothetical protein
MHVGFLCGLRFTAEKMRLLCRFASNTVNRAYKTPVPLAFAEMW